MVIRMVVINYGHTCPTSVVKANAILSCSGMSETSQFLNHIRWKMDDIIQLNLTEHTHTEVCISLSLSLSIYIYIYIYPFFHHTPTSITDFLPNTTDDIFHTNGMISKPETLSYRHTGNVKDDGTRLNTALNMCLLSVDSGLYIRSHYNRLAILQTMWTLVFCWTPIFNSIKSMTSNKPSIIPF